jgi:hypothetical protein
MSEEQAKNAEGKAEPSTKSATAKGTKDATPEPKNVNVQSVISDVDFLWQWFLDNEGIGGSLTGTDRRRLVGVGVRNNGFIDKAFDIAIENPQFMPAHFDVATLTQNMHDIEDLRQLLWTLQQFVQAVSNALLVHSDSAYRDALRIYDSLREQSRNRVDGAEPLFRALASFFSRRRKPANEEPTEMELERDIKRLIHGKADGEIVIKNERPNMTGGVHEVIDNVHKDKTAFKATEQGSVTE